MSWNVMEEKVRKKKQIKNNMQTPGTTKYTGLIGLFSKSITINGSLDLYRDSDNISLPKSS